MREAKQILKMTRRSVRSNTGRYLALLLIVLLSVGFFSGLKVTKPAMQSVLKTYLDRQKLYDFRLLSRTGFPEADAAALNNLDGIEDAEGAVSADVMAEKYVLHVQSLQDSVNLPSLTDGRMPEKATECLADRRLFGQEDIGRRLDIDTGEFGQAAGMLCVDHVTIVGLCDSPAFISTDRGTASVGSGSPDGFILVPKNAFIHIIFTEIDLTVQESAPVYSDRYDELIDDMRHKIEDLLDDRSMSAYILTRRENPGYRSFENDTAIVSGIANIFPVFFILIGMLVCVTTMTRMVEENRTETGTLKALGYSSFAVSAGYLIYAGSAALLGWAAGYFAGTWGLPQIFWLAYSSVYGFAPLPYLFDPALALITLLAAEAGILLSTYFATRTILAGQPAQLIRPRTAKSGKRILIERITPLWKRLSFLSKITLRNMFRYKQRLIMMLTGISCCAGLVLTGFGVRDSLIPVTHLQYDRVQKYQIEASAESGKIRKAAEKAAMTLRGEYTDGTTGAGRVQRETGTDAVQPAGGAGTASETETAELIMPCSLSRVTLKTDGRSMDGASMYAAEDGTAFAAFWNLGENHFPGEGETVVCTKIAQQLGLRPGDTLTIEDPDMNKVQVKVSGIFENYIGSVLIVAADTLSQQTGDYEPDTLLIRTGHDPASGAEASQRSSEYDRLRKIDGISSVTLLSETRRSAEHALSCVHYIILVLVLFSGALEFIVIYNLTSINLEERSREIATVKVLGFYPGETDNYVLRENLILSAAASLMGIPLGYLFHRAVMGRIIVENMVFYVHIRPFSCLAAAAVTILFAVIVNLAMRKYIRRIPMAESLKAVE